MKILILGGTGAIGTPLVEKLSKSNDVRVTSRSKKEKKNNITYIQGNAKENSFFSELMKEYYDVIIDFMIYSTNEFKERVEQLLNHTNQYVFFSSARCYAESEYPLNEESPRLIDVVKDKKYLSTDEYAISKGREENLLICNEKKNWTIIRPYITYNVNRIQLGVYEKENWLKRALDGKSIVFPKDIASKKTSLTYAQDVVESMICLIGNDNTYGQIYNITTEESITWGEILNIYNDAFERITGEKFKVLFIDDSIELIRVWNEWQIKYDRLFNRTFDNSKIKQISGKNNYKTVREGLEECLEQFIENPTWNGTNIKFEAWCDRKCGEWTSLNKISGYKAKLKYLKNRICG